MEEKKRDEKQRGYAFIRILGLMVLALFMLVSIAGAAPFAYIPNAGVDSTISIIDTENDTVIKTIILSETEQYWPYGVAANKEGTKVYVTNSYKNSVSVIDTVNNVVTATVPVGNWPMGVTVTPDGTKVYVANKDSDTVSVINTANNTVIATLNVGDWPNGIAVTPDGTKVYVTNQGSDNVSIIDTRTNEVADTINIGSQIHGGQPSGVAVTPDGTRVYVVNFGGYYDYDTVSVIDTSNNTVIATVNVGAWPEGIAINPTGTRVYVTNSIDNTVSVIDTATNIVIETVPVGDMPYGVAVTLDGKKVYVGNINSGTVSVINAANNTVTATLDVGNNPYAFGQFIVSIPEPIANFSNNVTEGYAPLTVSFTDLSTNTTSWNWDFGDRTTSIEQSPVHTYTAAGNYTVNLTVSNLNGTDSKTATITILPTPQVNRKIYAYISNSDSNNVSVIDTTTDTVIATVDVGSYPCGVAVSPDGLNVYVANWGSNNVSVIDPATNTVKETVTGLFGPYGVAVSPDGTRVYVANFESNNVSIIDANTNKVTSTINVGDRQFGIAVSPDGKKVYVTHRSSNNLSVINTTTDTVVATVGAGVTPSAGVAVSPDGSNVYVANFASHNISVIDTATNTVKATVDGGWPYGVAVSPDGKKVYAGNGGPLAGHQMSYINVIDTATNTVTENIGTDPNPHGVAVTPDGKKVYTVNSDSNSVSVIDTTTNTVTGTIKVGWYPNTIGKFVGSVLVKTTPTIAWEKPADIVSGTPLSTTQLNAVAKDPVSGATIDGTFTYNPAAGAVLSIGTQTLHVDFTPTDTSKYNTNSKDIIITVLEETAPPVADFLASPTVGKAPLTVTFTDQSTGSPISWYWKFGDRVTSTAQNPVHTYSEAGKYTVSLKVKNAGGSDTRKISKYIIVKK